VKLKVLFLPVLLLGALGCKDDEGGPGGLYVYDNRSSSVLVWADLEKLHDAARDGRELPEADRTIRSRMLDGITLAWGGMALDPRHHRLYLVSDSGRVHAVSDPGRRNGSLSGKAEITSFSLGGDSDRFSAGSVFGPAAVDPAHDTLYVMENARDGSAARVWRVAKASGIANGQTLARAGRTFHAEGDRWGAGLAANPEHKVYALFGRGEAFDRPGGGDLITGPRLREAANGAFPVDPVQSRPRSTLIGERTLLSPLRHGSLAYGRRNRELFVLVPPAAGDPAKASILVFGAGQFHGDHDQPPSRILPGLPGDLRIIVHAPDSDWMAGAASEPAEDGLGRGRKTLHLWPSSGSGKPVAAENLPGAGEIRGLAIWDD